MMLLMPWGKDDGNGATVDLPAEYFVLLPLVAHRRLFGDFARTQAPPDTIFLHELSPVDAALNAAFVGTDSWKMIEILRSRFRDLSGAEGGFAVGAASVTPQSATGAVSPQQATDYQLLEGL